MERKEEVYEIDLLRLLRAIWYRAWIVILAALLGAGAFFAYATFGITPLYQAETMLYVNNSSLSVGNTSLSISGADITTARNLIATYQVILKSRNVLNAVIEEAGLDYSYGQLKGMISSSAVNETEVFRITVTSPDRREAELIANTIADVLPSKISDIIDGSSARIVDRAVLPGAKASPNVTKYTGIGMMLGIVLSCAVIVLLELMDTQIHSEDDLLKTYHLPVLAVIPDLAHTRGKGYYYAYKTEDEKER